jgi:hypothetical protein
MTGDSSPNEPDFNLSEEEKARIRAEVRYAASVAKEVRPPEKTKSAIDNVVSFLSSGIVLLLVGSFLTGLVVPGIQQRAEIRKQKAELLNKLVEQFLVYGNTVAQEYFTVVPLTQESKINKKQFDDYTQKIFQIQLKQYDALAKVSALATNFDDVSDGRNLSDEISNYSQKVEEVSKQFNSLIIRLYDNEKKDIADKTVDRTVKGRVAPMEKTYRQKEDQMKAPSPEQENFDSAKYFEEKVTPSVEKILGEDRKPVMSLIGLKVYNANHPNLWNPFNEY